MRGMIRNPAIPVILALAGSVAAPGCGDSSLPVWCDPPCAANEECVSGVCSRLDPEAGFDFVVDTTPPEDDAGAPPDDGTAIDDGRADAGDDAGPDFTLDASTFNIGAACGDPSQCVGPGDPNCMTEISVYGFGVPFPGGYCSSSCDPGNPDSCGPAAVCLALAMIGWEGCATSCTSGATGECREDEGYTCLDLGSFGIPGVPPICAPRLF